MANYTEHQLIYKGSLKQGPIFVINLVNALGKTSRELEKENSNY